MDGDGLGPTVERIWEPGTSRGARVPWWLKLAAKQALARLPLGYRAWARLGLFRHGRSDRDPSVPVDQFGAALAAYQAARGGMPRSTLELGPGDALGTALAGAAQGVGAAVLVDAGDFATRDMTAYQAVADCLAARGMTLEGVDWSGREALLASIGARYLTRGVASLAEVAGGSVDLGFSFAVLEHVPRDEMALLFRELFRIAAPGGVGFHFVDLTDHLGGGLNHLRFAPALWEAGWFRRGGFYTNRLRGAEIVALAGDAGFAVQVAERRRFAALPLPRARMHPMFRGFDEAELRCGTVTLVLRKPA